MRLLLCIKPDLTSVITLNTLMAGLGSHDVRVLVSTASAPRASISEAEQLRFFERNLPFDLLFPLIDQGRAGGGRWLTLDGLKRRYGIQIFHTNSPENPMTVAGIAGFQPDLILSLGFDLLFGPKVLKIPSIGTLNVHPGFLPRYAGLRAPLRALIEEEQRIGCVLHLIDGGINTGAIVAEDSVPITSDRSLHSYKIELHLLGAQLFLDALDATSRGRPLTGVPQSECLPRPAAGKPEEQYRRLRELGVPAVKPADYCHLVRRFLPGEEQLSLSAWAPLWARSAA